MEILAGLRGGGNDGEIQDHALEMYHKDSFRCESI